MPVDQSLLQDYYQSLIDFVDTVNNPVEDDLIQSINVVLAIDCYEKLEKRIIAQLGQIQGEKVIYPIKVKGAEYEKQQGGIVLQDGVERLEAIFALECLYGAQGDVPVADHNNQQNEDFLLKNSAGRQFRFEKFSQYTYQGNVYFEMDLLEEIKIGKLNYYMVVYEDGKQKLVRERNPQIIDTLYELCEIY
ncbi:MAG: hypothetical protein IKC47_03860 [Clostridia bacterium]|nr:hypothetical protein [Clostridia bacterium]